MTDAQGAHEQAQRCVAALTASGMTVATAESITGGGLAAAITTVPGASAAYAGGVVSYAVAVKREVLGVDEDLLDRRGAVDPEVADQMSQGVRRLLGTTYGIATTGSAGPDPAPGGSHVPSVRPGTVYVALAGPQGTTVRALSLSGDREEICAATVAAALTMLAGALGA